MSIVVRRVFNYPSRSHYMSVLADGGDIRYVFATGVDNSALTPERTKMIAQMFEEATGKEPETSEDWAEIASYNLGIMSIVDSPLDQNYQSLDEAEESERASIDADVDNAETERNTPILYSDETLPIMDGDSLAAMVDSETGKVAGLTLLKGSGSKSQQYYRVDGQWSDSLPDGITDDQVEDLDLHLVSTNYVSAFDGGAQDINDVKANASEEKN